MLVGAITRGAEPHRFEQALERGWWTAARHVSGSEDGRRAAVDRLEAEAEAAHAERLSWLRSPAAWTTRWSRTLPSVGMTAGPASAPAIAAGITAWGARGAVHAVALADGRAAWQPEPTPDTTLFPRLVAPRSGEPHPLPPPRVAAVGHLVFAIVDDGDDGPVLICLDCSNAAEGRLRWSAAPPDGRGSFDGPPVADAELCAVIVRSTAGPATLDLVVSDARDGRLLWRRSIGTGMARDGIDHAQGLRSPALCEDLIVVADHAGGVTAWFRDGRPAWTHAYDCPPGFSPPMEPATAGPTVAAAGGTVIVAPFDRGGIIALEMPPPHAAVRRRWETPAATAVRLVGVTTAHAVVEATSSPSLTTLAMSDGRTIARATDDATAQPLGAAILAGDVIVQPIRPAAAKPALRVLDAATLRAVAPAFTLAAAARENRLALAAGEGALVVAGRGMLSCIVPSRADTP